MEQLIKILSTKNLPSEDRSRERVKPNWQTTIMHRMSVGDKQTGREWLGTRQGNDGERRNPIYMRERRNFTVAAH